MMAVLLGDAAQRAQMVAPPPVDHTAGKGRALGLRRPIAVLHDGLRRAPRQYLAHLPDRTGERLQGRRNTMFRKIILALCFWLLVIVLFLTLGEATVRCYHYYKRTTQQTQIPGPMYLDEKVGWRNTPNYIYEWVNKDAGGEEYIIHYKAGRYGFRIFGDIDSNKLKMLFLGDSFTRAWHVSNDKTYYGIIQKEFPVEIFAYGGSGYGSLQEYMILDEYIDLINPSLIIWQYCSNDFINNSLELELSSHVNNNGMRRPYLTESKELIYQIPKPLPLLRYIANEDSQFLYLILSRLDRLAARLERTSLGKFLQTETVETEIARQGSQHPGFQRAARSTNEIMRRVRARSTSTRIIAFSVDDPAPYYEEFQRISQQNMIEFIDGIPQVIREAESRGIVTKAADHAHWNEVGHRLATKKIMDYLGSHYHWDQHIR